MEQMKASRLARLKFVALLFLLPGLAGLIVSAMISTHYLDTLPKWPSPAEHRFIPRGIHGTTVYQTPLENRDLNLVEYTSVGVFLVGLGVGVVYLEKWGSMQPRDETDESEFAQHSG